MRRSVLYFVVMGLAARFGTALADPPASGAWSVSAGGGVWAMPRYPGSDSLRVLPVPAFDVVYERRYFLRTADGLGVYLVRGERCWISASVAPDFSHRHQSDDSRLDGLGDVQPTARAMLKAGTALRPWLGATASVATDIAGQRQGTLLDLTLDARQPLAPRLRLDGGTGLLWANRQYRETFFGVNPQQSAASGLPQFAAGSGFSAWQAFLGLDYQLGPRWTASGRAGLDWLLGASADSPITEKKAQPSLSLVALYRF